jgi:predicted short-subunit dehydrogenase-like oxidoreductase (DUF2520 family)
LRHVIMGFAGVTNNNAIAIVGAGRLGTALARLLKDRGANVRAIASRTREHAEEAARFIRAGVEIAAGVESGPGTGGNPGVRAIEIEEVPAVASHVLISVSDSAIASVAQQLASAGLHGGGVALHTSGSRDPEELSALAAHGVATGAIHPFQTIPSPAQGVAALPGCYFATSFPPVSPATSPAADSGPGNGRAQAWAAAIIRLLDGKQLSISPQHWALYHAAAVFASNYLVTLIDAALEALETAGVSRIDALAAISPMCQSALANAIKMRPDAALTGPIARGDASTVLRNREGLRAVSAATQEAYRAIGLRALPIAARRGLPEALLRELERALS